MSQPMYLQWIYFLTEKKKKHEPKGKKEKNEKIEIMCKSKDRCMKMRLSL